MKQSWIKGLTPERTAEIRKDFISSLATRRRLEEILRDKIQISSNNAHKKENYELASWPYLQADNIGYERAINEIISLISDKSE